MAHSIPTADEVNAMTSQQYKVYENRLRRAAARQGLRLAKSRTRDPRALDYNGYMLTDVRTNTVVAGASGGQWQLDLPAVERYLLGEQV